VIALAGAISTAQTVAAETTAPVCQALVSRANDLYLVSDSGAILRQFTTDGAVKQSPAVAPDGTRVAFIPAGAPQSFVIANGRGQAVTTPVESKIKGPLTAIAWNGNEIVSASIHAGQLESSFNFYEASRDFRNRVRREGPGVQGQACTARGPGDDDELSDNVGCLDSADVLLDNRIVYSEDIFAGATQLSSVPIALGMTVPLQSTPPFSIQLVSITDGVTLKVTLPTGNWIEERVPNGSPVAVNLGDETFGFTPTIADTKRGIVQVVLVQSTAGSSSVFDPSVAWFDHDHAAVIRRPPSGAQLLLIDKRGPSNRMISGALDVPERIQTMWFSREESPTDDTKLRLMVFRTLTGFGYAPVTLTLPDSRKQAPSLSVGVVTALPGSVLTELPSGSVKLQVLGWNCK
jgi:hypothetical protein